MPGPNLAGTYVSAVHLDVDSTDRPGFDLTPNSKVVNALLMIAQIPHETQVQNRVVSVPRSQIHCVLWNVWIWRGFSTAASLDLG
jgi:hypothetical protein